MARVRGQDARERPAARAEGDGAVRAARQGVQPRDRPGADWIYSPEVGDGQPSSDPFEFTLDADWRITSITAAAAAWCGSTVENLLGRNGREVNPAATALLGDAIDAALKRGETTRRKQPSTHVPGRWVTIEVGPIEGGARIRFADVTEKTVRHNPDAAGRTLGPAEIVLLDQYGVITAANAAWRAAVVAQGLELANAGVGARYATVGKALAKGIDEAVLQARLDELLSGKLQQFEATYEIETKRGLELRQVRIAPLRVGDATYFAAIHEDLSERAKILATLNETSDQLLHAQEMERQRIAIELHDSMSQHLAGLVMGLAQLRLRVVEDQRSQGLIDDMAKLTQLAIRETRVLSYLMNAAGDNEEGLEAPVRRFVEGFGRRTGLKASFRADGPVDAVSAAVRHTIFRVTQEALSNVYRHAKAARVSVELVSRAGALTVRIADDGRGIDRTSGVSLGEPLLGVGIPGMRARIEQLGGELAIGSGPRGGAVVTATIPLRQARPALAAVAG
jgi:signal transduction histidine kinase